jgi:hypothetical protein
MNFRAPNSQTPTSATSSRCCISSSSPPEPQSSSSPTTFEFDCSLFDDLSPSHHSLESMYDALSITDSQESSFSTNSRGISRSRCERNLSSLSSASSAYIDKIPSMRLAPTICGTGPNIGWGYYVDVPARHHRYTELMNQCQ